MARIVWIYDYNHNTKMQIITIKRFKRRKARETVISKKRAKGDAIQEPYITGY